MNRVRHIFTRDLGRKALALALAVFIWWRVSVSIEETVERTVILVPAEAPVGASDSATETDMKRAQIRVVVPPGWQLVKPKYGDEISLQLRGARVDIEEFMAEGAVAELNLAQPTVAPNENSYSFGQDLADMNWRRGSQARLLLAGANNPDVLFELARSTTVPTQILPSHVRINGEVPQGFEIAYDQMTLTPDTVQITGPIAQLPAANEAGVRDFSQLLAPVELPAQSQSTLRLPVRLSDSAIRSGLSMEPDTLFVDVPIFVTDLLPFRILPKPDEIVLIGDAPSGEWAIDRYKGSSFEVSYKHDLGIVDVPTQRELLGMITFFVDLNELPEDAADNHELPIDWMLRGASQFTTRSQYIALRDALSIVPDTEDYASLVVTLDKLEEE